MVLVDGHLRFSRVNLTKKDAKMQYENLKNLISTIKGTTFAGLDTLTEVKLKGGKKNPFQGRVQKKTTGANVMLYNDSSANVYGNMVKKRMVQEGKDPETFELKPRAWGVRIDNSPFIEHKDKYYLECIFISPGKSVYLVDGVETPKDEIEGLETEKKVSETAQGRIENKIILRTFSLDSIQEVRLKGTSS